METLFCQLCGQHREPGPDDMDPDDCGGISLCAACRADTESQITQGRKWSECQFCQDRLLEECFEEQQAIDYGMCKACQERLEKLDLLVECHSCQGLIHEDHTDSVCTYWGSYYEPPEYATICKRCSERNAAAKEAEADLKFEQLRDEGKLHHVITATNRCTGKSTTQN